jgi:hypothetical protein
MVEVRSLVVKLERINNIDLFEQIETIQPKLKGLEFLMVNTKTRIATAYNKYEVILSLQEYTDLVW